MINKVSSNVSEYIQNTSPLFVSFLELYYRFVSQRTQSLGIVENRNLDTDIDHTLDIYVDKFYSTYGKELGKTTSLDKRNLVKLLNEIYSSKGTEQSFQVLFRTLFGIEVNISTPSDNILRASDGKWSQELFFTVHKTYGSETVINSETDIVISGTSGQLSIKSEKYVSISSTDFRVYYPVSTQISVEVGNEVNIYSSAGEVLLRGNIVDSPSGLTIVSPGNKFKVGQTFTVGGTVSPTIFRVTKVNSIGGILSISVVDFGYEHTGFQNTKITPYLSRPSEIVGVPSYNSGTSTWSVSLHDYVYGISENATVGTDTITSGRINSPISFGTTQTVSISDYVASIAEVSLNYAPVSKLPGKYLDNSGFLSDSYLKLQDNYYYQAFSYVVESEIDIGKYKDTVLKIAHPAGMKAFSRVLKSVEVDITDIISTDMARSYGLDLYDTVSVQESIAKTIYANRYDRTNTLVTYAETGFRGGDITTISGDTVTFGSNPVSYILNPVNIGSINSLVSEVIDYFAEDYAEDTAFIDEVHTSGSGSMGTDTLIFGADSVVVPIV